MQDDEAEKKRMCVELKGLINNWHKHHEKAQLKNSMSSEKREMTFNLPSPQIQ